MPLSFALAQNYPNPFNPSTKILFSLPSTQTVSLKVFDLAGNEVATLINHERKPVGHHEIMFDASGLANGVNLYRLHAGEFSETKKMLLVKRPEFHLLGPACAVNPIDSETTVEAKPNQNPKVASKVVIFTAGNTLGKASITVKVTDSRGGNAGGYVMVTVR